VLLCDAGRCGHRRRAWGFTLVGSGPLEDGIPGDEGTSNWSWGLSNTNLDAVVELSCLCRANQPKWPFLTLFLTPGHSTDWLFISVRQDMQSRKVSGAIDKWGSLCDEGIPAHARYLGESGSGRKREKTLRSAAASVCLQVHSQPGGKRDKRDRNILLHSRLAWNCPVQGRPCLGQAILDVVVS
jgi:hypothetical protein